MMSNFTSSINNVQLLHHHHDQESSSSSSFFSSPTSTSSSFLSSSSPSSSSSTQAILLSITAEIQSIQQQHFFSSTSRITNNGDDNNNILNNTTIQSPATTNSNECNVINQSECNVNNNRNHDATKMTIIRADVTAQCSICLDAITLKAVLHPCFHQFCHTCIFEWYKKKEVCPVCRQTIHKIIYNIRSDLDYHICWLPMITFPFQLVNHSSIGMVSPLLHEDSRFFIPHASRLFGRRVTQVCLYQMLGILHQHHPELGFPTCRFTFALFSDLVRESSLSSVITITVHDFFRCFIYLHRYIPLAEERYIRTVELSYFQSHPTAIHRLVAFFRRDIGALFHVFNCPLPLSPLWNIEDACSELLSLLNTLSLCSTEFQLKFQKLITHMINNNLTVIESIASLADKFYEELVYFAKSAHTAPDDYCQNIVYQIYGGDIAMMKPLSCIFNQNQISNNNNNVTKYGDQNESIIVSTNEDGKNDHGIIPSLDVNCSLEKEQPKANIDQFSNQASKQSEVSLMNNNYNRLTVIEKKDKEVISKITSTPSTSNHQQPFSSLISISSNINKIRKCDIKNKRNEIITISSSASNSSSSSSPLSSLDFI